MRAVAFALSLLVLGSYGAAAQAPSTPKELNLNPWDVGAIGVGALIGFFVAESAAIRPIIGIVAGSIVGAWWYAREDGAERPQIKPTAAREAVARQGETPTLVLIR